MKLLGRWRNIKRKKLKLIEMTVELTCFLFRFVHRNKYIERELHQQCINDLRIKTLTKDDSIDPNRMIECLKNLIKAQLEFENVILHITHYYSVLADGTVTLNNSADLKALNFERTFSFRFVYRGTGHWNERNGNQKCFAFEGEKFYFFIFRETSTIIFFYCSFFVKTVKSKM